MSYFQTERSINWHMGWADDKGPFPTQMVETTALALRKPARDLDAQEVRLLVSQNLALEYAAPLALQLLQARPMANGGAYYGDLLNACLALEPGFWAQNRSVYIQFRDLLSKIRTTDTQTNARVDAFLKLEIEPTGRAGKAKKTKGTR